MDNNQTDDQCYPGPSNPKLLSLLIIIICGFAIGLILFDFNQLLQRSVQPEKIPYRLADEAQRIGIPTNKFDGLLDRIKNDINKKDIEIKVLVGPYYKHLIIIGLLVPPEPFDSHKKYLMLIDADFVNKLSPKEQEALIAHEAGHILFRPTSLEKEDIINAQVDADTFAARYVTPEDVSSLLDKLFAEYIIREKNIKHLIESR